ncbi:MAG: 6-phosphofructokinase, partial [Clostridia bacterium]|nr:6-phosphofructokinase [Clostridia bacterium]
FNNVQLGGVGAYLADVVTKRTGIKSRAVELSLMQRCAAHISSKTDVAEAYEAGRQAVLAAVEGETGKMIAFKRISSNPYQIEYVRAPLDDIAKFTQPMPDRFISNDGTYVTDEFIEYAKPLIQGETPIEYANGLPVYAKLKKELVEF